MILRQLFLEYVGQTSGNPLLIEIDRAEGIYMYAPDGKRYTDLISGVTVSNIGHGNKYVTDAVCRQVNDYMHLMVYGEFVESPQVRYAQKIASVLPEPLESVYFVNSGSEAVEGALKLAKRYTGRTELIAFKNAYHGSTHGALSVMGGEEFRNAFRPLIPGVRHLNFNVIEDLKYITDKTAAVIIEPIQGEGGVRAAAPEYLKALRKQCDETGTLLIFDEIQTGFGRTGEVFATIKYGVTPDILVLAKALGGGMPLGAFISSHKIMECLKTNPVLGHITTFGGHPVCCAAGLAAFEYLIDSGIVKDVERKGRMFEDILTGHPLIKEIRRTGLLLAIEIGDEELNQRIIRDFVEEGLAPDTFLFCESAFRIAPPLIITDEQIEETCETIITSMNKFM